MAERPSQPSQLSNSDTGLLALAGKQRAQLLYLFGHHFQECHCQDQYLQGKKMTRSKQD